MRATKEQINQLLPQTQCEECGFKGCRPYATAIAAGTVGIDQCPPGGTETVIALGKLLNIDATPFLANAEDKYRAPSIAYIDESLCIGCMKCINACPVDAIVGAAKLMHTVIHDLCTGCGLCVEPCPMDCIEMQALPERTSTEKALKKVQWQAQHEAHLQRIAEKETQADLKHESAKLKQAEDALAAKKKAVAEAIARANSKRNLL